MNIVMATLYPAEEASPRGGVESAVQSLVQQLSRIPGVTLHVVAPAACSRPVIEKRGPVGVHWLPAPRRFGFLQYSTTYRRRLQACIRGLHPDITHFQGLAGWAAGYAGPHVLTIHGIPERDVLYSRKPLRRIRSLVIEHFETKGRRESSNTIVINPYVRDTLGGELHGNLWSLPNPVTADVLTVQRRPREKTVFFAGRVGPRKNVLGLLRAFHAVLARVPEARLVIAGAVENAGYFRKCTAFVERTGMRGAVRFVGPLARKDVVGHLASATCLALLSRQETAPMIIAEALCAGLPVVASNVCGHPFMVADGEDGWLVDADRVDECAARLALLLADERTWSEFSENARRLGRATYSPEVIAEKTFGIYEKVIAASGGKK